MPDEVREPNSLKTERASSMMEPGSALIEFTRVE
jgi:hypothetical protein